MIIGGIVGAIIGVVLGTVVYGILIWIVGKFGLGLEVDGFGPAFMAAFIVSVMSALVTWGWSLLGYAPGGGLTGTIINLLVAAGFLQLAGNAISGIRVQGYRGALVAAVAIAVISWVLAPALV